MFKSVLKDYRYNSHVYVTKLVALCMDVLETTSAMPRYSLKIAGTMSMSTQPLKSCRCCS